MFWIILWLVLTILVGIFIFKEVEVLGGCLVTLFLSGLIFILSALGLSATNAISSYTADTSIELKENYNLIALNNGSDTIGKFFLGSGQTSEEQYYYYIKETELGYKQEKIKVDFANIKYDNENPHIEVYARKFTNPITVFFAGNTVTNDTYIFYIPEGSIIENYEIGLK